MCPTRYVFLLFILELSGPELDIFEQLFSVMARNGGRAAALSSVTTNPKI